MPTLRNWKDFITNSLFIIPTAADFMVFEQASRLFATRIFIHITYITTCMSSIKAYSWHAFYSYERETNVIRVWKERCRHIFNDRAEIDNRQLGFERGLCNPHRFDPLSSRKAAKYHIKRQFVLKTSESDLKTQLKIPVSSFRISKIN